MDLINEEKLVKAMQPMLQALAAAVVDRAIEKLADAADGLDVSITIHVTRKPEK